MIFVCDRQRHLVCLPYSVQNLHAMADELGIKRCWFHKDHYDVPKRRIQEIQAKCCVVRPRTIVKVIRRSALPESLLRAVGCSSSGQ